MGAFDEMVQLAKMLETEFRGGPVDRRRMRELASSLLPRHPELRHTLSSVCERLAHA